MLEFGALAVLATALSWHVERSRRWTGVVARSGLGMLALLAAAGGLVSAGREAIVVWSGPWGWATAPIAAAADQQFVPWVVPTILLAVAAGVAALLCGGWSEVPWGLFAAGAFLAVLVVSILARYQTQGSDCSGETRVPTPGRRPSTVATSAIAATVPHTATARGRPDRVRTAPMKTSSGPGPSPVHRVTATDAPIASEPTTSRATPMSWGVYGRAYEASRLTVCRVFWALSPVCRTAPP